MVIMRYTQLQIIWTLLCEFFKSLSDDRGIKMRSGAQGIYTPPLPPNP